MNAQPTYHTPRAASFEELHRLDMTFTESGLKTVKAFRQKIAAETGRSVSLGQALDVLLKSHPFVAPCSARRG